MAQEGTEQENNENLEENKDTSTAKKKQGRLMSLFTPLENFAKDNAKDIPLIRSLDEKLNTTTKRILLAILAMLFLVIILLILVSAFRPHKSDVQDSELSANTTQAHSSDANVASGAEGTQGERGDSTSGTSGTDLSALPSLDNITAKPPVVDDKNLLALIQKADLLYKSGGREEALSLFNQIANYSKSIANYSLGVINARSKDYEKSIQYYDEAINSGEDITLSAINAAVSALRLGDMDRYRYYINIANTYINQLSNLPPYAYSYALSQYYNGQYFEALSPLSHNANNGFDKDSKRLAAKLYTLFNDNVQAYNNLEAVAQKRDELALGQLLARQGSLNAARGHVYSYMLDYPNDWNAKMTMQLISLKLGDFIESAKIIDEFAQEQRDRSIDNPYPIKARVSPTMFDVQLAQGEFWNRTFEHSSLLTSKILFYYAPYRVFNVSQALNIISDGVLDSKINLGNLEESRAILIRGATISNINVSIAQALKRINHNDLRGALATMQQYIGQNPNHAVLHYNLGLIYAQMGDFGNAYKHFLRAYHLDSTDIQSGVFAVVTGNLIYKNTQTLNGNVAQSIYESKLPEGDVAFYNAMRTWANDPKSTPVYTPNANERRAIYLAFQSISAMHTRDINDIVSGFEKLKTLQPRDVVSNILFDLARNYGTNIKTSVLNLQYLFRDTVIDLDNVFYGPNLARELYVYIGFITGNLSREKEILNEKLSTQTDSPNGILQALALLNIYQQNFQESYAMYDRLINILKEDDSNTRLMGAVAAIGAGYKSAASLLLQLSKMDSNVNYESKYALGLLYQEEGNYNVAAQHYNSIANRGFRSEYIDFVVDDDKVVSPE